jgi:putative membrane protein
MMYGWDYSSVGGWWMLLAMAIVAVAAVACVWLIVHRPGSTTERSSRSAADELLRERFARGEISREEFEEARRVLG